MRKRFAAIGLITLPIGAFFFWGGIGGRVLHGLAVMFLSALVIAQGIVLVLWGLAAEEDKNNQRSSKKIFLLITPIIAASVFFPYFLVKPLGVNTFGVSFEKSIIRNTSSSDEETALTTAENLDYSGIFNLQRYATLGHVRDPWPYTWAQFIDTQVIEYYDYRFESLRGTPQGIDFSYDATVIRCDQIRVMYVPAPENGSIYDDALQVLGSNGTILLENPKYSGPAWGMRFALHNDFKYQEISAEEIDFTLSQAYIVEMTLEYNEVWGPLAAFFSRVYQVTIVGEDFEPFLLCVLSKELIS